MNQLRKLIDRIDQKIVQLLSNRQKLTNEIGRRKKEKGQNIQDKKREKAVISKIKKTAKEEGLDQKYVEKLYEMILEESRKNQSK